MVALLYYCMKNARIAVIGVFIVAALGTGLYFLQDNAPSDVPEDPNVVDPYAGWKTYTNEEYGFSFKYPGDYILEKPLEAEDPKKRAPRVTALGDVQLEKVYVQDKEDYGMLFSVTFFDNPQNLSLDRWMSEKVHLIRPIEGLITKSVTVAGIPALRDEVKANEYYGFRVYVVFLKGGGVFEIRISTYLEQLDMPLEEARDTFQQLVDSFEFTQ
jgi:hypothetical protein